MYVYVNICTHMHTCVGVSLRVCLPRELEKKTPCLECTGYTWLAWNFTPPPKKERKEGFSQTLYSTVSVALATYGVDGINKILISTLLQMKDNFMQNAMYTE